MLSIEDGLIVMTLPNMQVAVPCTGVTIGVDVFVRLDAAAARHKANELLSLADTLDMRGT